jgi:hypothetical protein
MSSQENYLFEIFLKNYAEQESRTFLGFSSPPWKYLFALVVFSSDAFCINPPAVYFIKNRNYSPILFLLPVRYSSGHPR